jgi:hypothetical protein
MSIDQPAPTRYLTIGGVLLPDNRLLLEPGFTTEDPADPTGPGEDTMEAVVEDGEGRTLLRHPLAIGRPVADGEHLAERLVLGKLPLPAGARRIRFVHRDIVVHELEVPAEGPRVELAWDPPAQPTGRQVVAWKGEHPEGRELRFVPCFTNDRGRTWQPLAMSTTDTEIEVDFDRLPGGQVRIGVLASDGVNTVKAQSRAFRLPPRPCLATIVSPEDGATLPAGEPVLLHGQGYHLEQARPETEALSWTSSVDGDVGTGEMVMTALSPGSHELTLSACSGKRRGEATITVQVEEAT